MVSRYTNVINIWNNEVEGNNETDIDGFIVECGKVVFRTGLSVSISL